ncbi:hypothetical protein [Qipengyuania qiaonensis]|uniref:Uncharacterized protein n=1 Tax=Qipengyuania qiaonensis TaxID=2867240 RepID=A0ABS7J9G2_9SPHN|nr:hypothetical protein [Qipengyuania qiaonensis]MBX7483967.1 hypothetical protein [Qipengyuania qiaonensis]
MSRPSEQDEPLEGDDLALSAPDAHREELGRVQAENEREALRSEIADSAAQIANLQQKYQDRLADLAELGHILALKDKELIRVKAIHEFSQLRHHILTMLSKGHGQLHGALSRWKLARSRRRAVDRLAQEKALIETSGLFDADWYLELYPDIAQSGEDPIRHYVMHGAYELRDPGPRFSAFKYHKNYPDVTKAGIPALSHYIRNGRTEGRRIFGVGESG